ncbi:MAG: hypothetical protein J6A62_07810, partial [Oscillospiraceae bacterium]|nr:hypothetical protein [Oscillospiraceae bacterium]
MDIPLSALFPYPIKYTTALQKKKALQKKRAPLESYSKGQSYVGYGVAREGCTVFLCSSGFKRCFSHFLHCRNEFFFG